MGSAEKVDMILVHSHRLNFDLVSLLYADRRFLNYPNHLFIEKRFSVLDRQDDMVMNLPNTMVSFTEKEEIRDIILESMLESLEAQVRALKKLRGSSEAEKPPEKSMSQLSVVLNILEKAGRPLHVSEIIGRRTRCSV